MKMNRDYRGNDEDILDSWPDYLPAAPAFWVSIAMMVIYFLEDR